MSGESELGVMRAEVLVCCIDRPVIIAPFLERGKNDDRELVSIVLLLGDAIGVGIDVGLNGVRVTFCCVSGGAGGRPLVAEWRRRRLQ